MVGGGEALVIKGRSFFPTILFDTLNRTGTAVAQLLRCCATNRKVAVSTPDDVIRFFLILPIALWPWGRLGL